MDPPPRGFDSPLRAVSGTTKQLQQTQSSSSSSRRPGASRAPSAAAPIPDDQTLVHPLASFRSPPLASSPKHSMYANMAYLVVFGGECRPYWLTLSVWEWFQRKLQPERTWLVLALAPVCASDCTGDHPRNMRKSMGSGQETC